MWIRRNRLCLSLVVFLVAQNVVAEPLRAPRPTAVSLIERYRSIIRQCRKEIAAEIKRGNDREVLHKLFQKRDRELRRIVASISDSKMSELTLDDLIAIAASYENLRDYENSLRYGLAAIDRDHSHEMVYPVVVRSLLNLKRPDEAAVLLHGAESHLPSGSSVFELHYFIYHRYRANGENSAAAKHFTIYMDTLASRFAKNDRSVVDFSRHLKEFVAIHHPAGGKSLIDERLRGYKRNAKSARDKVLKYETENLSTSGAEVYWISGLYHVECELALTYQDPELENITLSWCNELVKRRADSPSLGISKEILRAFRFVEEHSDQIANWRRFAAVASENLQANLEERSTDETQLKIQKLFEEISARWETRINSSGPPSDHGS